MCVLLVLTTLEYDFPWTIYLFADRKVELLNVRRRQTWPIPATVNPLPPDLPPSWPPSRTHTHTHTHSYTSFQWCFCSVAFSQGPQHVMQEIWTFWEVSYSFLVQSCFRFDNPTVHCSHCCLHIEWLAQGCPVVPSTACYYAANWGDNPCKPVTDSLVPVHGLLGLLFIYLFFLAFAALFSLHSVFLWARGRRKCRLSSQSLVWV